jgi:Homeodomain-like domain
MHTTDKVNQFIELRAKGLSIPTISQRLGVPASTLYDWHQRSHDQVQKLKRAIFEEIEETVLGTHHIQFDSLAYVLKAIDRQIIAETYKRH